MWQGSYLGRLVVLVWIIVTVAVFLVGLDSVVSASGIEVATFQASFKFAQEARGTAYRTDWLIRSAYSDSIQFHTVYLTMPTQVITREVGEDGYSNYASTDLTYTRYPRGFRLVGTGGERGLRTLAETSWSESCLPGPELSLELYEGDDPHAVAVVRNSTTQTIRLYDLEGVVLRERSLSSNEWQTYLSSRPSDGIVLRVIQEVERECAALSWTLPPPKPKPVEYVTTTFRSGWELFTMPQIGRVHSASSVLSEMIDQGTIVDQIVRWRDGAWDSHIRGLDYNNFSMEQGRAYFLRVSVPGSWRTRR